MSTATSRPTQPEAPKKPRLTERDRQVLDSTFAIDSRVLAILRIAMATFILIEAAIDWDRPRDPDGFFEFLGQYGELIVIPFAVMLLLGFKTRWAVLACWLTYGLTIRATFLDVDLSVDVGDYILTLSLFWSIFLPLGRHLSLDARGTDQPPVRFLSLASAAFLLQIFIIYLSAGLLKETNEWVFDATALESILSNPRFSGGFSEWILQFPTALAVMSVATIVLEVIGSILIIVPGKTLPMRR
ncbi:MAG TPA: HTTM domain-containing protein, partial [Acidimicrobiia bacterium]|nr:HTTM domain-containing protein [Acidimicrobiia bacterium]